MLYQGNSIRGIERMTGTHRDTNDIGLLRMLPIQSTTDAMKVAIASGHLDKGKFMSYFDNNYKGYAIFAGRLGRLTGHAVRIIRSGKKVEHSNEYTNVLQAFLPGTFHDFDVAVAAAKIEARKEIDKL